MYKYKNKPTHLNPDTTDSKKKKLLQRFFKSSAGNTSIIAAFSILPMIAILGGAVDLIRYADARAEIQGALDSGILAAATLSNTRPVALVMEEYLEKNVKSNMIDVDDIQLSYDINSDFSGTDIKVTANYSLKTAFAGVAGINTLPVKVVTAAKQDWQELEVALVLDISSSMNNSKLSNLKTASKVFIDTVLTDDVRTITSINVVPFGGTVYLGDTFLDRVDADAIDNDGDGPPDGNGYDGLDHSDGHEWKGCFEFNNDDFGTADFDSDDHNVVPFFWKWTKTNPWCPHPENEALFLSNDNDTLKDLIDALTRSDGTGMDIGAAVGLKSLSPSMRGQISGDFAGVRPTDFNSQAMKVLIIMTDGEITAQYRPDDGCARAKNVGGNGCQKTTVSGNTAKANFYDVCDAAKDNNILIYTIGFQIKTNKWSHTALADCPQSESQYYFVEDLNIESAFSAIAATINGIRITQ